MHANSAARYSNVSPREAARELLRRQDAQTSLLAFTEYTVPGYIPGYVHQQIAAAFDRVEAGEVDRLLILTCPQHGKSQLSSQRYPAYSLGRNPAHDVISASAVAMLAEKFGQDVRNCISSREYQNLFPGTRLAEDSQAKGQWRTQSGGSYYAVGIGGAVMGRGATRLVIDDPFASMEEAQSQRARDRVWDWYTGTAYNRVRPGGAIVVICHRMHEDDLAGRLLASQDNGDKWTVVELPVSGVPLWPERFNTEFYARLKAVTPPLYWSALYEQNPQPEEGTFFKREWFWFYKPEEARLVRKYLSSDFAFTENGGDYTEIGIHGVGVEKGETRLYLCMDGWYGQADQVDWVDQYLALVKRHRPIVEFGEGGMPRRASEGLITRMRREQHIPGGRVEWVPSVNDKVSRAASLRAMASMGRVGLPDNDYGHRVLAQLLGFPAAKHDDAVDMCGLMARVLDQAHPAMAVASKPRVVKDRWDKAFEGDEGGSWRV